MYSKIVEIMHRGEMARKEQFLQNKFLLSMLLSVFFKAICKLQRNYPIRCSCSAGVGEMCWRSGTYIKSRETM